MLWRWVNILVFWWNIHNPIQSTDPCVPNPCTNDYSCFHVGTHDGQASQNSYRCEHPCNLNPCFHGGNCTIDENSKPHCDCSHTGYGGPQCNIGMQFCELIAMTWWPKHLNQVFCR